MRLRDGRADYGWISIGLHWIGAGLVAVMLFVGDSAGASGADRATVLGTHTTIGLMFYALLWGRILWRAKLGHPAPLPRQKALYYRMGKITHHALLAAIAVMLLTGPLAAWSGPIPLRLFDWTIPSPVPQNPSLYAAMRRLHLAAASVLGWGALLHILAVIKHTAVDRDGSLDRILVPLEKTDRP